MEHCSNTKPDDNTKDCLNSKLTQNTFGELNEKGFKKNPFMGSRCIENESNRDQLRGETNIYLN